MVETLASSLLDPMMEKHVKLGVLTNKKIKKEIYTTK